MLNLNITQSALSTFHMKFLDGDLPDDLSLAAFQRFDKSAYDEEALARARVAWGLRTLDEYRSQVAFTELLSRLTQTGFAFDILGTAVRVVRDEARHVELCKRMLMAVGGSPVIDGTPRFVRSDQRLPLRSQIIQTVVGSLCIGETVSVRLLAAVRDHTVDPLARAVVTCLTADESIHSRFGWTLLSLMVPHISTAERQVINQRLPIYLGSTAAVASGPGTSAPPGESPHPLATAAANPFGSLPVKARREVFFESLENDIFRNFDELGIDARAAWDKRTAAV